MKKIKLHKMKLKCILEFEDYFCGKVPRNRDAIAQVLIRRMSYGLIDNKSRNEISEMAKEELSELGEYPRDVLSFYRDGKGLYIKYFDIIGMIKERIRQMGLSQHVRGIISAVEGLNIYDARDHTWKIYLRKPSGEYVKPSEVEYKAQYVNTYRGTAIVVAECVKPPIRLEFIVEKNDAIIPNELFLEILRSCNRLGGLRKVFGRFKWISIEEMT